MHHLFQRLGITPDEFYAKPFKVRVFMLASMQVQLDTEEEEREEERREWERRAREGGRK